MRILVVEDDPVLGDGLSRSLRHAGYAVDTAQDGKLADDLLSVHAFDWWCWTWACLDWTAWRCCGACAGARLRLRC